MPTQSQAVLFPSSQSLNRICSRSPPLIPVEATFAFSSKDAGGQRRQQASPVLGASGGDADVIWQTEGRAITHEQTVAREESRPDPVRVAHAHQDEHRG